LWTGCLQQAQRRGYQKYIIRHAPLGSTVYLKQFAEVREDAAPTRLERRDRMPSVKLSAQVIGLLKVPSDVK
jgi:multidrug efflux pump subunit AcrB